MRSAAIAAALLAATLASAVGLRPVARSAALELAFDTATAEIAVRVLSDGRLVRSVPDPAALEPSLGDAQRRLLLSPFQLSYLDRTGRISFAADAFTPGLQATWTPAPNGVRVTYRVPVDAQSGSGNRLAGTLGFSVAYTLVDDGLEVRVPGDSLVEEGDVILGSLQVLPFFGANRDREGGGLVLPDGLGAFIAYRRPSPADPVSFLLPVYGEERYRFSPAGADSRSAGAADVAASLARFEVRPEEVALPLFGLVGRSGSMAIMATAGAEMTRIRAALAGHLVDWNRVGPEFVYRRPYLAFLSRTATVERFQQHLSGGDRAVRYLFAASGDWGTVADAGATLLPRAPRDAARPSVIVRVLCGVKARGLFGDRLVVATTFPQAATIVRDVHAAGIAGCALVLVGWEQGGYAGRLPRKSPPDGAFGGEAGLRELVRSCHDLGVPVFLESEWGLAVAGGRGARMSRDALRDLNQLPVTDGRGAWLISPRVVAERIAPPELAAIASWGVDGVAFRNLGRVLIGDLGAEPPSERSESLGFARQLIEGARSRGLRVMVDGANAYSLGLAEGLYNAPVASSRYLAYDEDVPLLARALAGAAWLAAPPLNLAPDPAAAVRAAARLGMAPTVELTAADPAVLKGTVYGHLVRSRWTEVLEDLGDLLAAKGGAP